MSPVILVALLAATPGEPVEQVEPPPPARAALWVNLASLPLRHFTAGGSLSVARRLVLTVDFGWSPRPLIWEHECADTGRAGWASVGLAIRPFGEPDALGGFFLLPKIIGRVTSTEGRQQGRRFDGSVCTPPYANGTDVSVGLGATVGWDWILFKHLLLGISAGGGGLACFNCASYRDMTRAFEVMPTIEVGARVGVAL